MGKDRLCRALCTADSILGTQKLTAVHPELNSVYPEPAAVYPDLNSVHPERPAVYPDLNSEYPESTAVYPELNSEYPERRQRTQNSSLSTQKGR